MALEAKGKTAEVRRPVGGERKLVTGEDKKGKQKRKVRMEKTGGDGRGTKRGKKELTVKLGEDVGGGDNRSKN